jgi:hypothetical protein
VNVVIDLPVPCNLGNILTSCESPASEEGLYSMLDTYRPLHVQSRKDVTDMTVFVEFRIKPTLEALM